MKILGLFGLILAITAGSAARSAGLPPAIAHKGAVASAYPLASKAGLGSHDLRQLICDRLRVRPSPDNWSDGNVWMQAEARLYGCDWFRVYDVAEDIYQELFQSAVGLAGAAGNFDGNGRYVRSSAGGGSIRVQTPTLPVGGPLYGNAIFPVLGTRPAWAGKPPPVRRDVPCYRNAAPNVNNVRTGAGP